MSRSARLLGLSQLGFKTAVGMPFKDIATTDSVYLEQVPAADDKNARTSLRRMQEVKRSRISLPHKMRHNQLHLG